MLKKIFSKNIVLSAIAVVVSLCFVCGVVYAWFTMNDKVDSNSDFNVISQSGDGFIIDRITDTSLTGEAKLYPGKSVIIEITVTIPCPNFGIGINDAKPDFDATFSSRPDLTTAYYEKASTIITSTSPYTEETIYETFDVAEYLTNDCGLSDTSLVEAQKLAFFKKFFDENSAYDVLSARISKIDNVAQDIALVRISDTEDFYPSAPVSLTSGQKVIIILDYRNTTYIPTATYAVGESEYFSSATGDTTYRMKNYNCFIGQTLTVSFKAS